MTIFNTPAHKRSVASALEKLGIGRPNDVFEENVTDLLANLMHLCHDADLDFDECLADARRHYHREFVEPDDLAMNQ